MKRNLKPIIGALVAGLVGVAQATCYYETSFVCLYAGTAVGTITVGDCSKTIYSWTDWYGWTVHPISSGYNLQANLVACQGTAYYDWCDSHRYFLQSNDGNGLQYQRVNYNSQCGG